jgi:hypothetical protein
MSEQFDLMLPDDVKGLTSREFTLLSRIHTVCMKLANHDRAEVLKQIIEDFDCDADVAEQWLAKAEDYMAMGAMTDAETARSMYHLRLSQIYSLCMANAITDEVEQTTKPMKLEVEIRDQDGQEIHDRQIVNASITKVRPNRLNTGALAIAMKAAREAAHILGGRPRDPKTIAIGALQINNEAGMSTAQQTHQLANDQLAQIAGLEIIDVEGVPILPEGNAASGEGEDEQRGAEGGDRQPEGEETPED